MNRAELLCAAKRAAAVAPSKSPLEVLKGALLEVDAAHKALVLTATNLEVILKQKLNCAALENDALVIDAGLLAGMLEKLSGDTVELRREPGGSRLIVQSGDSVYSVSVWERSSYPKQDIPALTSTVRASGIPTMAKRTVFATCEDDTKPMMKCVCLRFTQDGLRAAGSDGNCVVTAKGDDKCTGDLSVLIPAVSLTQLARMCGDKDEFRVGSDGKRIVFIRDDLLFSARLIEGDYIDTDYLTSSLKNQFTVLTDIAELSKALDSVVCVEPDGKVKLSFDGMMLTFQSTGVYGSATNTISVIPLTGTAQGEYWYLAKRLTSCMRALSGTATLGIAQGGMLTLSAENAFYMQSGVRPGTVASKRPAQKKASKSQSKKAA